MDFHRQLLFIWVESHAVDPRSFPHSSEHSLTLTQPGNYDHPPASSRNASTQPQARSGPATEASARLQNLRELLESDRAQDQDRRRRALETLDRELSESSAEPMSTRIERRRRGLEDQIQNSSPMRVSSSSPDPDTIPINHTSSLMRSRRRPAPPSDRLQRHINRLAQFERSTGRSLAASAQSDLPAHLPDPPQPPRVQITSPDITPNEYPSEPQVSSNSIARAKRRKLDSDGSFDRAFSYEHYGQVVPGPLKMQLVSCDGGHYNTSNDSLPDCVLKDDPTTVYSTKSNRANILIRHYGCQPFSLTKLVIKAPQNGYDAGIQQGMVFVSMEGDDLIERTDMYRIKYSPRHRPRHSEPNGIRPSPSQDYLNSVRSPLRSLNHSFVQGMSASVRSQPGNQALTAMTSDFTHQIHEGPPLVPDFHVTNEYEEKNDEDGFLPNHQSSFGNTVHLDPLDYNTFFDISNSPQHSSDDSSSDGDDDEEWQNHRQALEMSGLYPPGAFSGRTPRRSHDNRRQMPNQIELGADMGSNGVDFNEKAEEKLEPLLPHAKFFIPKEKYLASVKFDPPV
ncbi:MAG: hypothetical protein Q9160_006751 [Pyrenula sp. 1 TL-2023]